MIIGSEKPKVWDQPHSCDCDDSRHRDSLHSRRRQHPNSTAIKREKKEEEEEEISTESDARSLPVCCRRRCAHGRGINLNNSICEEHLSSPATGSETRRCGVSVLIAYSPSVKETVLANVDYLLSAPKYSTLSSLSVRLWQKDH